MLWGSFFANAPNVPSQVYQDDAGNKHAESRLAELLAVASRFKPGKTFARRPR
jgi:hypothetical protein